MKDIEQYFANGRNINKEATATDDNVAEQEARKQEEIIMMGKRKRVKIRILRDGSTNRMCDIIDNSDLIDKTPSPFNGEVNDGQRTRQDKTPKSCLTESRVKRRFEKHSKRTVKTNGNQSEETDNISQEKELNEQIIVDFDNSSNGVINCNDESNVEFHNEIGSQREESNAFQILMSRSKPIQYKSPQQSTEGIESTEKLDYVKEFKLKCKEKLIVLADKKGYSKKKIAEMEEDEKIERNIENRMRFFKVESKSNGIHKKDHSFDLPIKNKHSSNLLDYFSKSPLKLANKDEKCMSTFIVKADVHRADNSDVEPIKPSINERYSDKKCLKSELDFSTADDIHIIASENLFSPQSVKQDKQKREKPRWSLRIKLHSFADNDSLNDTDDELFSPRSKSKFNSLNKSENFVEDNEVYIKDYNRHLKIRVRNKEKKELIIKDSNISSIIKEISSVDAANRDTDSKKSNKTDKKEQKINDTSEMAVNTVINNFECKIGENVLKRKPNEKLAPLFTKRRKTDPTVTAAKRLFLQSDIVDAENKNTDRKANKSTLSMAHQFPAISHVTQLNNELDSMRFEIKYTFPIKIEKKYLPLIDVSNYKYITNYEKASRKTKIINKLVKEDIERALSEIEVVYPDVRKMWKTISSIKGDLEKTIRTRGRKTRALERKKILTDNIENEENHLHNCAWTHKYKPMSTQEIVGNEEAAGKLRDWLSGWRASLTKETDGSSGDEFYSSDCSSSYNNENNQIAVLLGPHGSGKSASVYAIAEEFGYSVLEVNASSRRTGKRILKELKEATKSHRIKKSKHKSPFERITNENDETSKISQNSLILFEDIDLIFEEDEGFVSATYQLALNTKRPIVMTSRDTCPHLNKIAPQQNKVYFHKVSGNRVSVLLELISLAETGYRLPDDCLMTLLQAGDLRQALLQLQYLSLSGPPILSEQSTTMKSSLWQDMQHYLYKPTIKLNKKPKTKDLDMKNSNNAYILNNLAEDLDSLSLMSSLIDIEDTTLNMSKENVQPNLSLAEKMSFYSALDDLNIDIANFINDQVLYKNFKVNKHVQNQSNIILRKQLNRGVDVALSHVTSVCLDQRVIALDYLPTARTICRAEESRSSANSKRGSRFFHYLHSLKVPTASMKPNILAAACRMLQERDSKTASKCIVSVTSD
ncbi:ATPase family AAA domain-containing protein 5 [Monomorium pharaonis]|uniref:ATPase family AAA domain-containing protein 5 n=1 Tax=Monomorium pharaonis TaxID=307658 RepID=UPI00063FB04E|nr:ATPase family AAA domain-containing protein 5 [Monomorium pharaonis]